jgi:hypothetical protein
MIRYQLRCAEEHQFEAWFKDSASYEQQQAESAIACPMCGDFHVTKAIMAPAIGRGREAAETAMKARQEALKQLAELRRKVEENCDYVGPQFAEEARKIHYGEIETRAIYGETTPSEAEELQDEGIAFAKIPWLPRTDS